MIVPIHILEDGEELPEDIPCYIITSKGIFIRRKTPFIDALVKVEGISCLQELKPFATTTLPKLPAELFGQGMGFFRYALNKLDSEATLLGHYSLDEGFMMHCPEQTVSVAGVDYVLSDRIPGFSLVMSIHSHGSGGAFHSTIDRDNEKDGFDGIHITVGNVKSKSPSLVCTLVVNGNRFPQKPEDIIDGVRPEESSVQKFLGLVQRYHTAPVQDFPEEWQAKLSKPPTTIMEMNHEGQSHRAGGNRHVPGSTPPRSFSQQYPYWY